MPSVFFNLEKKKNPVKKKAVLGVYITKAGAVKTLGSLKECSMGGPQGQRCLLSYYLEKLTLPGPLSPRLGR